MDLQKKQARSYQLQLVDFCMEKNAIIYLPTGAGKTYVAVLVIKRLSHQLQKSVKDGGKRTIFMCNTVELARQQAEEIKMSTNLNIGYYVGEREVDSWDDEKWLKEIHDHQVLVGTAQVFLNILQQNLLKPTDINVIVFDECHHATKHHPMHEMMRLFQLVPDPSKLPRVIGLTGVLLKGKKPKNIIAELGSLESTFRANIVTVLSIDEYKNVMVYSTNPMERTIPYPNYRDVYPVEIQIKEIIFKCCEVIDNFNLGHEPIKMSKNLCEIRDPKRKLFIKNFLKDVIYQLEDYGLYPAAIAIMSPIIEFEIKRRQSETIALRNLYRYVITICESIRRLLVSAIYSPVGGNDSTASPKIDEIVFHSIDLLKKFSTPKVLKLLEEIATEFKGKKMEDICCLVFVERRYSAKTLYYVIKKFIKLSPELKDIIEPEFMVGRRLLNTGIEDSMERKYTTSAINKFRKGECNLIVCSNVLEEGIDIQACNYVFVLDELKTFNMYIQTKGRARSNDSKYWIFAPVNKVGLVDTQKKDYNQIHKNIREYLNSRILDQEEPKDEDIAEHFDEIFKPFIIPSGAKLLASSALTTLNRYCQMLPTDNFGFNTPKLSLLSHTSDGIQISVELPLQSPIKDIIKGDPMPTRKLAKLSAAFNTCKLLYREGELNNRLLPITKTECLASVADEFFQLWKKHKDDVTQKMTKNERRLYQKSCPEEFYNALPRVGKTCYAYEIRYIPKFEENEYNSHIRKMLNSKSNYALLLRKRLPRLAQMPLFLNQGQIDVVISDTPFEFCIESQVHLEKLLNHHIMMFRDILKNFMDYNVYDRRGKENSYLIVPLTASSKIDWDLVNKFQKMSSSREYSISEREEKIYRPEDYEGMVVSRWYGPIDKEHFVVVKVRTDLTPNSDFDDRKFKTFLDFYTTKYQDKFGKIVKPNQFLIEVKELTHRRNFFINGKSKQETKSKQRGPVILLPELCHNFEYPGDLWMKVMLLPSTLHRIYYMLHAEKIRRVINAYLGITTDADEANYRPKPVEFDPSLTHLIDMEGNMIDKDIQDPKSMLAALPSRNLDANFDVNSVTSDPFLVKEYVYPVDYSRRWMETYNIELIYLHNFMSGNLVDLHNLAQHGNELWETSQMDIATESSVSNTNPTSYPMLTYATLEDKSTIEILERSFDNSRNITTAELRDFLAAITAAGSNDIYNMERFELLGDSFLKFSVSLYLVNRFPKWHEGYLTEVKSKIVSNRNLMYCMFEFDIPKRVCTKSFVTISQWLPPMVALPKNLLEAMEKRKELLHEVSPSILHTNIELTEDDIIRGTCSSKVVKSFIEECEKKSYGHLTQVDDVYSPFYHTSIGDKTIADTLEAIMGVCVQNYGIHNSFRMLEFFGICKSSEEHPLKNLLELSLSSRSLRTNISAKEVDDFLTNRHILEKNLGYTFRDRSFLLQALTHPSYPTNRLTGCYQELEFIGDAILDFLISCYIFEKFKQLPPGKLTDLRSALVNNVTLGCVCVRHRFHLFLLNEDPKLSEKITQFSEYQRTQNHRVTNQVKILLEEDYENDNDSSENSISDDISEEASVPILPTSPTKKFNLSVNVEVPKTLGDVVEALIAAVYLDSRNIHVTWKVIYNMLKQEIDDFSNHVPIDAVRQLTENKHARAKFSKPKVENNAIMVTCQFLCLGKAVEVNGFGYNGKQARKSAAKHALLILARYQS